jgi:predicted unusual protein kinase regulating ubiquinone biosynthesis (AarF/ABC1/UbiB family)
MSDRDTEKNRFTSRIQRYARVGTGVGQAATRIAGARMFGAADRTREAELLRVALGNLKGPIMKVAQLLATIPEAIPAEWAAELQKLQSEAPPMGWAFVKRRMTAELGPDWMQRFASFDKVPAAAASLGQVHRAVALDSTPLAVKLQYPDMQSAVEADLTQLDLLFGLHRRLGAVIDTREIHAEIGARVREELDYVREARHMRLYSSIFTRDSDIRVPVVRKELSTHRLLTMGWLDGRRLLDHKQDALEVRNRLATAMFKAWWYPFSHYGVIHGDPHLGNYTVWQDDKTEPRGINLLDYGCIRIFPARFVQGVIDLYRGLRDGRRDQIVAAYEVWGFHNLDAETIDILNIWARFIYGPLLEDRVRSIADGVSPAEYGRRQAFEVHRALKEKGPVVTVPREFVFMDRAAIGLGGVFLHLRAELNFYRLYNDTIADFDVNVLARRQRDALMAVGLDPPDVAAA